LHHDEDEDSSREDRQTLLLMERFVCLCDLCAADGELVGAAGTYTTDEGKTFDACEDHLEECKGYGFATREFEHTGNVEL
jgi:hypothetical protein